MKKDKLTIAIIGTRGIPNRYGGFEACAEHLGLGLHSKGHEVAVYCPHDHPVRETQWKGIQRIIIKNPESALGTFGQFIYDLNCNLDSKKRDFDIIVHFGYTSDSIWYKHWAKRSHHIVNMDGMEWKRQKYGMLTKKFLMLAERLATLRAHCLVADNPGIETYLQKKYHKPVSMIAYGASVPKAFDEGLLELFDLKAGGYDIIVARMEPENNIKEAIEAKMHNETDIPLIIVGNDNAYKRKLKSAYDHHRNIRFADTIYDQEKLNSIRHFARYYIHGHSVGGTNPSLLEAMACKCRIIAHDNQFNRAVLGDNGIYFSTSLDLSATLSKHPNNKFVNWIEENSKIIDEEYSWDAITDSYERLFLDTVNNT